MCAHRLPTVEGDVTLPCSACGTSHGIAGVNVTFGDFDQKLQARSRCVVHQLVPAPEFTVHLTKLDPASVAMAWNVGCAFAYASAMFP
jgi:hypothetical protein